MAKIEDCPGFETFGADVKAARKAKRWARRTLAEMVRPLREFCVSDFRQNQEYHVFNVHDGGLFPLVTSLPEGWDGMRADTA